MAVPKTPARSALARSAAARAGYPIAQGTRLKLYALSNIARSGATRSNYIGSSAFVSIGGIHIGCGRPAGGGRIVPDSLTISDILNDTPNTCHFSMQGATPVEGQEVLITLGSKNTARREFAGWVLNRTQRYLGTPANAIFDVNCIDYTWGLNRHKVSVRFQSKTLQTIVSTLVSTYAPGYTVVVDANVASLTLNDISFTAQDLTACLTQACKRTGSSWLCDEFKVVRVFTEDTSSTSPTPLNAVHPSLMNFSASYDLSQVLTRVLSEGGGGTALAVLLSPGETILPVDTAVWYESPAGRVAVGTQRLRYTGVFLGGGGSLVGPGAAPLVAPQGTLASGAGVPDGAHDYAVTFVTASGESLVGPRLTISVGKVLEPATAPTAGAALAGVGPDVGPHGYAVSFVTAAGETLPGLLVGATSTVTTPPATGPTPGAATAGGSVDPGTHDYAVSFVTAIGETTVGPIGPASTAIAATPIPSPTNSPTPTTQGTLGNIDVGWHDYAVTYVTAAGETVPGPIGPQAYCSAVLPDPNSTLFGYSFPTGNVDAGWHHYAYSYVDAAGRETTIGTSDTSVFFNTTSGATFTVPNGNPGTTARRIYRSKTGAATFYLAGTMSGNTTGTYTDTVADSGLNTGQIPASTNQCGQGTIQVTTIQIGPSGTTGRKLYRRSGGAGLKLLTTIADNVTTSWIDGSANASLGAAPPASSPLGPAYGTIPVAAIETGPSGTTARKLYRRSGGAGLRLLTTLNNNSTTTYTDTTANASLGAPPLTTNTAAVNRIPLSAIPVGGPLVTARKIWGTPANPPSPTPISALRFIATLADNTTTTYTVVTPDASLGAAPPADNTAVANQVQLSGIPTGVATVTQRKVYRTAANTTPLKLLTTLADNTTTTYLDALADGSLGAAPPATDGSGLQQPAGAVLAGSTTLIMAGTGAMAPAGWAVIGNGEQVIRYTATTPASLTGIPASGNGAITASIAYNSTITAAPQLTGMPTTGDGALVTTIVRGDPVNLLVQEDDVAAQTALKNAVADPSFDGVQEDYLSDNRLSAPEAHARARAWLDLRKNVVVTIQATTHDLNTRSGRLVHVNLGAFNLIGDFMIQQVSEHTFLPAIFPTFDLTASSLRFTFEDWLRIVKREGAST